MATESNPPIETTKSLVDSTSVLSVTDEATTTVKKRPGKAGNIDYDQWDKVTRDLVDDVEQQEQQEEEASKKALGLDGKYARSHSEAEERQKAKDVKKAKKVLERYQKRESAVREELRELLGPVQNDKAQAVSKLSDEPKIIRITRDMIDAGKRVVGISDTSGASQSDTIVLTSDLSLLESKMKVNAAQGVVPKSYDGDAENDVQTEEEEKERKIFGVIKCFLSNVHNCTVILKCKVITGNLELSHCSNVVVKVEKDATIATVQADLCEDIVVIFNDAPSGKNAETMPGQKRLYWGQDKEDRIFHAGVKNMKVQIYRDGFLETEGTADYVKDGAKAIGNATEQEFQFVMSCNEEGELITEAIIREGSTTGQNARPMTKRDLEAEKEKRKKAANMAQHMAENMIKFKEVTKDGAKKVTKMDTQPAAVETVATEGDEIEEIYAGMSKEEIESVVRECEQNKTRGNEAFGHGEYAQAILLYSLALDKADELPDANDPVPMKKQLFARDVTLSNRAAAFLKLGQHDKAAADAKRARDINPDNVKALFRHGLSLHAMKQYQEALPVLAEAHKLEPKNTQIKEALQFAEVRLQQEMQQRMQGSNQ
jgi:tetratricopeptide (TPR) repeat protein